MKTHFAPIAGAALLALSAAAPAAGTSSAQALADAFLSGCVEPMMQAAPLGAGKGPDGTALVAPVSKDHLKHCALQPQGAGGVSAKTFAAAFELVAKRLTASERFALIDETAKDGRKTRMLWSFWPDLDGRIVVLSLTDLSSQRAVTGAEAPGAGTRLSLDATEVKPEPLK